MFMAIGFLAALAVTLVGVWALNRDYSPTQEQLAEIRRQHSWMQK